MKKITRNSKLKDIMEDQKTVEILFEAGLSCMGCPMAMQETLGEGCLAHGMDSKEIDELIKRLNKE